MKGRTVSSEETRIEEELVEEAMKAEDTGSVLSLIHISEPTRP